MQSIKVISSGEAFQYVWTIGIGADTSSLQTCTQHHMIGHAPCGCCLLVLGNRK
jgi:hypothetical protein